MSQHSIKVIYCLDGTTTTEESIVFEVDDSADPLDQARTVASTASEANMRAYGRLFNTLVAQNLQS